MVLPSQDRYPADMSTSGSRVATLRLVGGRPSIDLVNTVSWRGSESRREEHLRTAADCLAWVGRTGLVPPDGLESLRALCSSDERVADTLLASLHSVRTTISRHLVDAEPPDLAPLAELVREAIEHSDLVEHGGAVTWSPPLDALAPARLIALDLHDLLTRPPGPLGVCEDDACGWAFVDTSRGHNRRWCSSEDCGNRHRVRRHYQATRSEETA
jgi:predicted RNA-binding Zn ribbon-like protein